MTRTFPTDTLLARRMVLKAYRQTDPSLKLGTQDQEVFAASTPIIQNRRMSRLRLEMQLKDLRNQCDDDMFSWGMIKCARSTIKGSSATTPPSIS